MAGPGPPFAIIAASCMARFGGSALKAFSDAATSAMGAPQKGVRDAAALLLSAPPQRQQNATNEGDGVGPEFCRQQTRKVPWYPIIVLHGAPGGAGERV